MILLAGVAFLGFTISFAKVSGIIKFYGTPDFAKKTGYVSKYESEDEGGKGKKEELVEDVLVEGQFKEKRITYHMKFRIS
jgi:hypothetical protein